MNKIAAFGHVINLSGKLRRLKGTNRPDAKKNMGIFIRVRLHFISGHGKVTRQILNPDEMKFIFIPPFFQGGFGRAGKSTSSIGMNFLKCFRAAIIAAVVLVSTAGLAAPSTSTWSGSGSNRIWNYSSNWDVLPVGGENLVFPALVPSSTVTNTIDNFPNGTGFNSLAFATNYFVSGNSLLLTNGISSTVAAVTINNTITLGAAQVFNNGGGALIFNGTITNGFGLTFRGAGTTTVGASISGNGNTTVDGSDLVLSGAQGIATNSPVITLTNNPTLDVTAAGLTLGAGQTLKGVGNVAGELTDNGTLSPGFGIGAMTFGNDLTLGSGANVAMDIKKTGTTLTGDQVAVGGTLTYGGTLTVAATGNVLASGDSFTLFSAGNYTGGFGVFNLPALGSGLFWTNTLSTDGKLTVASGANPPIVTPAITNLPATSIQGTTAIFNGQVIQPGGLVPPSVIIYYGLTDAGTNTAGWANHVSLGFEGGNFSYLATNLAYNTTYYFTAMATNSAGKAVATPSQSFTTTAATLPTVMNLPPSNVQGNSAYLNGQVVSVGSQTPTVTLYYGLTDGGTNIAAWGHSVVLGLESGNFNSAVAGLAYNTTYYYTVAATNVGGRAWATPSQSFTTLPAIPATVTSFPVTSVEGTSATLSGAVLSVGSQTPTVIVYYGPADGGTNAAGWSNSVVLGLQTGSFNYTPTNLVYNSTYYYTVAVTNIGGIAWAAPSQSFATLGLSLLNPTNTTQIQYLSGTDKDHTVPWQFYMTGGGRSNNVQTTIPVPSCWQTKGFGNYSYQNNPASTSVGQYGTTFAVPSSWAGQRIFLVFEGALTDTAAAINGRPVGPTHQGGFYEFSYDVTTNVVPGASTNMLNVIVSEWSANASVNQAEREGDYWNFSGIFRPVYLMAKPQAYIDRLTVDAQASGLINVNAYLGGINTNYTVVASVTDPNNFQLGNTFSNTVGAGASNVLLTATLPSPQPWSSEFPNLYTLTVQLLDTNDTVIHTVTNLIGFRTITFSNGVGYLVNGKKVLLRGICRHEFWPTDGRTTSLAESDLDIKLIKDMNFNAVRMSHYPPNKLFLQECDRLGLYVFDELTGWQHAYDNTIAPELVREMVIRDVNHPSIIAWDNGNEGGWNTAVDNDGSNSTNVYAIWDPQNRHVNRPLSTFNNVVDDHYPTWNTFSGRFGPGAMVYLPTEINHGLYDGGGGASLSDYWDMMRTSANGGGMFLWAFLDEGVVRDDEGGQIDVDDQAAPDGIVGPYRQPEASYYSYKSVYNPAQVTGPAPGAPFNGALPVENRFSFTSLSQCTFDWQLGWYPDPNDPASVYNTSTNALTGGFLAALDSGGFAGPNVPPDGIGTLVLPGFPANGGTNYDALRLTATDPFGNNLYTWTWPLHTPAQIHDRLMGNVSASAPAIAAGTSASEIIITNGPRIFHFNKTTGVINSLTVSNQAVSLSNGPRPAAGSAWTVTGITNYSDGTNYIIRVNDLVSAANGFQWTLRPDGWLTLTYRYTLTGSQNYMGITFDYPTNKVTAMNWLGQGPYRVYKNRLDGQEVFVHTKAYNYTWTGQDTLVASAAGTTPWVYPEFEGYHGKLNWATLLTVEQPITVVTPTPNLFFRVLTPATTDKSNVNPAYPPGNISLLDGIAPQGDKFRAPGLGSYGPSSVQNTATGLYTGSASFFFGPPPPSGADRDGNGLIDTWELQYFGALGQNPLAPASNGVSVALDNVFGLSPTNADPNASRLPKAGRGTAAPVALLYRLPVAQLDDYTFTPQLTDNLLSNWFGADAYPQYFLISSAPTNATEDAFSVQPNLSNWLGNSNHLFLRLKINEK